MKAQHIPLAIAVQDGMSSVEVWPNKHVDDQAPQDVPDNFLQSISRGSPRKWDSELRTPGSKSDARSQGNHPRNLPEGDQPSIAEAYAFAGLYLQKYPDFKLRIDCSPLHLRSLR